MLRNLKNFSLPEIEEKVLQFWKTHGIFKKSLAKNDPSTGSRPAKLGEARPAGAAGQAPLAEKQGRFVFYEGPPTANGRPGIHHLLARSFKDVIPRFKTMQGYFVARKAGWDTHGLPVEIEAEKELGMKSKSEIEKFGIAEFNSRCKELIWKYRSDWEQLTNRMGFWLDLEHPYITYENSYMESVWWLMSQIHKNGHLKKLLKTVPWCTRCQTPLSSHELGQPGAYKLTKDPSLYIKVRITQPHSAKASRGKLTKIPEFLLVWTTTPWTLPGNLAIAVHPKLTYTKYQLTNSATGAQEYVWAYNPPPAKEGQVITVMEKISGRKLVGTAYEPLYPLKVKGQLSAVKGLYQVRAAEFVSTEDGSGLVHIAPSFGEEDFKLMGIKEGLPITVDERGVMAKGFPGAGKYIKEADKDIVADLTKRGLLYALTTIEHEYPYCWRCNSALIYIVRLSWFIEMSKLRDTLLKENEKINWTPAHIKDGRFGEWLKEVKDWSISRNRYWGTPLPIWECEKCEKRTVVGSLADLNTHAARPNRFFFVRHGEAEHNTENRVASGPERGKHRSMLTAKGKLLAEQMASKLKKEKIDLIFTSPYQRTRDTARFIAKATKARTIVDGRLKEIQVGEFNTSLAAEYRGYFANNLDRFYVKPVGNSETLTEVRTRMMDFIREINAKYKGKTIVVVSHGDPLWLLEGALRGLSDQEFFNSGFYPNPGEAHEARVPNWPYDKKGLLDLHRPFIDNVLLACPECKKPMSRVKDVLDVWFDAGAMPFASVHFPFSQLEKMESGPRGLTRIDTRINADETRSAFAKLDFPADYISEGIDQTRGWFYTLLAISTLLGRGAPYKNVVCLGLVLDKNGQKMSKSKGNVINPTEMMAKHGADAVRWYFYTMNDPGEPKRFNEEDLAKTTRKFILILYNSFVFWNSYGKRHETLKDRYEPSHVLDRWILSITNRLIVEVTKKIEAYQIGEAGRLIEQFTDDLSRWYIRRSRDRFQANARGSAHDANDWEAASFTLQTVLLTLSKLLAPFMPFFSEALYLAVGGVKESVHLEVWPEASQLTEDSNLLRRMAEVRRLAAETLALRAEAKLKVRQPLSSITLKSRDLEEEKQLLDILADEVNVKKILFNEKIASEKGVLLDTQLTPALKEEGIIRELARTIQGLRQDANYKMGDEIVLMVEAPDALFDIIQRSSIQLKKAVSAKELLMKRGEKFDVEFKGKVDEWEVWVGVRKV